jgi:hypothetical protein
MGRRLYYQDSYGNIRRARDAERASSRSGGSPFRARGILLLLVAMALIMVIASVH